MTIQHHLRHQRMRRQEPLSRYKRREIQFQNRLSVRWIQKMFKPFITLHFKPQEAVIRSVSAQVVVHFVERKPLWWDSGFDEREDSVTTKVVEDKAEEVGGFIGDGYGAGCGFVEEGVCGEKTAGEHGGGVVLEHG